MFEIFDLEKLIQAVGLYGVATLTFIESGLLIGVVLPGDAILFTAGILAGQGIFNLYWLVTLCFIAAVIGDNVGYTFGKRVGRKLFLRPNSRWFKKHHLLRTEAFYQKHGGKTIILARFMPVVRVFAPIVAGISNMNYSKFLLNNIIGAALWAIGLPLLGAWIGSKIPNIDNYLIPAVALIVIVTALPETLQKFRRKPS